MNYTKNTIAVGMILIIIVTSIVIFFSIKNMIDPTKRDSNSSTNKKPVANQNFDAKNSTFTVNGKSVTLTNGISDLMEITGDGLMIKTTTKYFGNEARGDLNNDGLQDMAFLITQDTGGSGIFYYVVVAMQQASGYKTTNAFLIGDRIAPQSTEIQSDSRELRVNYAERNQDEPMTAEPSVGATKLLKVTRDGVLEGLMK